MIKLLSVAIFAGLFFASQARREANTTLPEVPASQASREANTTLPEVLGNIVAQCWTQWYDRDNPSGSGDWEILSRLRKEHPGQICSQPAAIEAQTLSGLSVAAAGDVIYLSDTTTGFICRNQDQRNGKMCNDYRVRFSCPPSYCVIQGCWTQWFDRDDPSGTGDWETLFSLRKENPGKICSKPAAIEVQTLTGLSVAAAGDVIYKSDTATGFVCRNKGQRKKMCNDYRVRFRCPPFYCDIQFTV